MNNSDSDKSCDKIWREEGSLKIKGGNIIMNTWKQKCVRPKNGLFLNYFRQGYWNGGNLRVNGKGFNRLFHGKEGEGIIFNKMDVG